MGVGHVAIWIGTKEELKQLGIWDHEVVRPYHEKIESGHGVIEALRIGVTINTLAHFMNIDDMAIIREPEISDKERAEDIIRTFRQL